MFGVSVSLPVVLANDKEQGPAQKKANVKVLLLTLVTVILEHPVLIQVCHIVQYVIPVYYL